MPCPLLTYEYYDILISANAIPEPQRRLQVIRKILKTIPPSHFALLRRLCELLKGISQFGEENKMTVTNLAICFSPTLIRSENMKYTFQDLRVAHELLETFVSQISFFFYETDEDESSDDVAGTMIPPATMITPVHLESCEVPITFEAGGVEISENEKPKEEESDFGKEEYKLIIGKENIEEEEKDFKFEMSAEQLSRKSVVLQSNIDFFKTLIMQEGGALFLNNNKMHSEERSVSPPPIGFPSNDLSSSSNSSSSCSSLTNSPNLQNKRRPPPPPVRKFFSIDLKKEMEYQFFEEKNKNNMPEMTEELASNPSLNSSLNSSLKKPPPPPKRHFQ